MEGLQKIIQSLRAQLADAKTTTTTAINVNNNVNNSDILMAQADEWKLKIDKIYNDIRTAQENYYTMSSKEKLLKLRTKYKEYTEHNRKKFNIDGEFMKRVSKFNFFPVIYLFSVSFFFQS